MKYSDYKLQASNFVVVYEDKIWDRLTAEKVKEVLGINSESSESVEILENSELNIRVLNFKNRNKRLTIDAKKVVVDELSDFQNLDREFSSKILSLVEGLKSQAIGFNFEVQIVLQEKMGWQQFFSDRVATFVGEKDVKNFGFKFQIAEEDNHSWIMNIATAIKDDGNLYIRLNSHHDKVSETSLDLVGAGWEKSLGQLKSILTNI